MNSSIFTPDVNTGHQKDVQIKTDGESMRQRAIGKHFCMAEAAKAAVTWLWKGRDSEGIRGESCQGPYDLPFSTLTQDLSVQK